MNESPFVTLAGVAQFREDIKGSIFLAYAQRADTLAQVNDYLHQIVSRHSDASHLCWAYKIGNNYRFSDGGEPSGTAGQPILRAIEGQGLDHTVVGVIRYFGGTLLGAGGLMRAYGHSAAEALRVADRIEVLPRVALIIETPYEHTGVLYRLMDAYETTDRVEEYDAHCLRVQVRIQQSQVDNFTSKLRNGTRGQSSVAVAA